MNILYKKVFLFALYSSLIVATLLTAIVTIWEWLDNPSGIFYDQNNTNYQFLFDTALSWFLPTFIYMFILSAVNYLLLVAVKSLWVKYKSNR